jgi:hypothetical protein
MSLEVGTPSLGQWEQGRRIWGGSSSNGTATKPALGPSARWLDVCVPAQCPVRRRARPFVCSWGWHCPPMTTPSASSLPTRPTPYGNSASTPMRCQTGSAPPSTGSPPSAADAQHQKSYQPMRFELSAGAAHRTRAWSATADGTSGSTTLAPPRAARHTTPGRLIAPYTRASNGNPHDGRDP